MGKVDFLVKNLNWICFPWIWIRTENFRIQDPDLYNHSYGYASLVKIGQPDGSTCNWLKPDKMGWDGLRWVHLNHFVRSSLPGQSLVILWFLTWKKSKYILFSDLRSNPLELLQYRYFALKYSTGYGCFGIFVFLTVHGIHLFDEIRMSILFTGNTVAYTLWTHPVDFLCL